MKVSDAPILISDPADLNPKGLEDSLNFIGILVQDVTYDLRSADSPIEYISVPAEDKNGGRVSISVSGLPAYCQLEVFKN